MFKNGWVRLWLVASLVAFTIFALYNIYWIWVQPICYKFVSVSVTERGSPQDQDLAEHVREEATTRTFCGKTRYSALLTIESLARKGIVSQVGVQWREPSGWSFTDSDFLDVLDGAEIKASQIVDRVASYVYMARLRHIALPALSILLTSGLILLLGCGVAWIRRGFGNDF